MDDLISRQAAIKAIDECYCGGEDSCGEPWVYKENAVESIQMIEPIQIAEPKRIRGKWIEHEHGYWTFVNADGERDGWIPDYECDQCGSRGWKEVAPMNFCPNCGAKMEVE